MTPCHPLRQVKWNMNAVIMQLLKIAKNYHNAPIVCPGSVLFRDDLYPREAMTSPPVHLGSADQLSPASARCRSRRGQLVNTITTPSVLGRWGYNPRSPVSTLDYGSGSPHLRNGTATNLMLREGHVQRQVRLQERRLLTNEQTHTR